MSWNPENEPSDEAYAERERQDMQDIEDEARLPQDMPDDEGDESDDQGEAG